MTHSPPESLTGLSLVNIARLAAEGRTPPVETWNPPHCGDSGIRILADGTWLHAGTPIGRATMVRLFSTVLRREADGSHVLAMPAESCRLPSMMPPWRWWT